MRRIFWGFCRNWFLMSPLHYLSSHYDFGFEFARDIRIRKTTPCYHRYGESPTPRISDMGSRQLPASVIRGVAVSLDHWYAESVTPRITDTESRLLNIFKENSPYRWYRESSTPRTSDTVSRRLPVLLSRRVTDSAYNWYRESTKKTCFEIHFSWTLL
jgi:hypothetical protein